MSKIAPGRAFDRRQRRRKGCTGRPHAAGHCQHARHRSTYFAKSGTGGVDVSKDLAPFITLGISPAVILVNADLNVKSLDDLVALAKRPPGLTYASSGTGTLLHMAGELFSRSAEIKITHVPYPGAAQAITDLIGGRVDILFTGYAAVAQHLKPGGKLIALAIINKGRSALAPDIPTLDELGYKDVEAMAGTAPTRLPVRHPRSSPG